MPIHSASVSSTDPTPDSVLAEFLTRIERSTQADLDELCAQHPDRTKELRRAWSEHRRALELLRTPSIPRRLANEATEHAAYDAQLIDRLAEHRPLKQRYEIEGEIARGGMGAILRVRDPDLRRTLAMKVVLGAGGPSGPRELDPISLGRFLEEAQVTGQLDHPGIVPVHELGLDDRGDVYFTMRLVKGREFREIIDLVHRGEEGWALPKALGVLLKACEAMAYAHSKGVVHRDLKPANMMVGKFGEVYVMDWGLARVRGEKDKKDIRIQDTGSRYLNRFRPTRIAKDGVRVKRQNRRSTRWMATSSGRRRTCHLNRPAVGSHRSAPCRTCTRSGRCSTTS